MAFAVVSTSLYLICPRIRPLFDHYSLKTIDHYLTITIAVDEDAARAVLRKEMEARGIAFTPRAPLGHNEMNNGQIMVKFGVKPG